MSSTKLDLERFPNFLIIGANKGGTTSLYNYCNQHPEIHMSSIKEPMYFTSEYFRDAKIHKKRTEETAKFNKKSTKPPYISELADYYQLFEDGKHLKARGEASTAYLGAYNVVIKKVKQLCPKMKFIISLRHPIDRAWSAYSMYNDMGLEALSFNDVVSSEINNEFVGRQRYLVLGAYYAPVSAYLNHFGKENVLVLFFDNLKNNPAKYMRRIFEFLGVDEQTFVDTSVKFNSAEERTGSNLTKQAWRDEESLPQIIEFFKEDVRKLRQIVDFGDVHWEYFD